jgi:transcriptional regulator with XRE-family HTH domain
MSVGSRIRDLRIDRRLGQGDLARRAGIAQNTLSLIELGQRSPTVTTLEKIARGLGVQPAELLERPDVPFDEARWVPRITADDVERQARSGSGFAKLATWSQQVVGFILDRRGEQQSGVVLPRGGLPRGGEQASQQEGYEAVSLDDPEVRAVWVDLVLEKAMQMLAEMVDFGVQALVDNLLAKDPARLEGEERENYTEAVKLSRGVWELATLMADLEREHDSARVRQHREESERALRKLMFSAPIQGDRTA